MIANGPLERGKHIANPRAGKMIYMLSGPIGDSLGTAIAPRDDLFGDFPRIQKMIYLSELRCFLSLLQASLFC